MKTKPIKRHKAYSFEQGPIIKAYYYLGKLERASCKGNLFIERIELHRRFL